MICFLPEKEHFAVTRFMNLTIQMKNSSSIDPSMKNLSFEKYFD